MNKKSILMLIILIILIAISINSVSASSKTITCWGGDYEPFCEAKVTLNSDDFTEDKKSPKKIVKQDGKYYYRFAYCRYYTGYCQKCGEWNTVDDGMYYKLIPVKKWDLVKNGPMKKIKTGVESKGRVYNYYKYKKTVAISSSKVKTVDAQTRVVTAYYKKIKMPNMKRGTTYVTKIGWQRVYYGHAQYGGWYVMSDEYDGIKVNVPGKWAQSTKRWTYRFDFSQSRTYQPVKPKWFKVYVKAY